MPNTSPEGVTPPPTYPTPAPVAGTRWFTALVSVLSGLIGIVIGMSAVFGGLGKAFFVERSEYTFKNEQDVRDKTSIDAALKNFGLRFDRQESALDRMANSIDKMTADLQSFKYEVARRMK